MEGEGDFINQKKKFEKKMHEIQILSKGCFQGFQD